MAYDFEGVYRLVHDQLLKSPHLSLADLSLRMHIERHTIVKALKAEAGVTFRVLRNRLLMEKARLLLYSDPTLSVKEIAFVLGYRSPQAFARFVKEMEGLPPLQLRASRRTKQISAGGAGRGERS